MKILLLTVFVWTFVGCAASVHKESVNPEQKDFIPPTDWKRTIAFSVEFYLPFNLIEKEPIKPMMKGSTAKFYGNENIWLVFTVLSKPSDSNEYSNQRDFQYEKTIIDGKQAEIITFTGTDMQNEAENRIYVAVLNIPHTRGDEENLKMWAYSKTPEVRTTVINIFKSVRFPKE